MWLLECRLAGLTQNKHQLQIPPVPLSCHRPPLPAVMASLYGMTSCFESGVRPGDALRVLRSAHPAQPPAALPPNAQILLAQELAEKLAKKLAKKLDQICISQHSISSKINKTGLQNRNKLVII